MARSRRRADVERAGSTGGCERRRPKGPAFASVSRGTRQGSAVQHNLDASSIWASLIGESFDALRRKGIGSASYSATCRTRCWLRPEGRSGNTPPALARKPTGPRAAGPTCRSRRCTIVCLLTHRFSRSLAMCGRRPYAGQRQPIRVGEARRRNVGLKRRIAPRIVQHPAVRVLPCCRYKSRVAGTNRLVTPTKPNIYINQPEIAHSA
jgi:hypothetical protein